MPLEDFSAPNIQFAKLTNKRIVMEQAGYLIIIEMVYQVKQQTSDPSIQDILKSLLLLHQQSEVGGVFQLILPVLVRKGVSISAQVQTTLPILQLLQNNCCAFLDKLAKTSKRTAQRSCYTLLESPSTC